MLTRRELLAGSAAAAALAVAPGVAAALPARCLSAGVSPFDTVFAIPLPCAAGDYLAIGGREIVKVMAARRDAATVRRGLFGTSPAQHLAGDLVQPVVQFEATIERSA